MSTVTKRRVARKHHSCDSHGCVIKPGWVYLAHTLMPGNDIWDNEVPIRFKECANCACQYGRDWLLQPIPLEQSYSDGYQYWLGDTKPSDPGPLGGVA